MSIEENRNCACNNNYNNNFYNSMDDMQNNCECQMVDCAPAFRGGTIKRSRLAPMGSIRLVKETGRASLSKRLIICPALS